MDLPDPAPEVLTGQVVDGWILDDPLGGSVYRAHHETDPERLAALKLVVFNPGVIPKSRARFGREAKLLHDLSHPNIVDVRSYKIDGERPYIQMELVEGESLADVIARGALAPELAVAIAGRVCDALAYLHERAVCHRDVKPRNILIRHDGAPKLVDFGVALDESGERLTQAASTFGTMSYTPPEWIKPEPMDGKHWDVYATGVSLWEMITGESPFPPPKGASGVSAAFQVMADKQDVPNLDIGPGYPEALRDLVKRMTSQEIGLRPSAAEAVQLLAAVDFDPPREATEDAPTEEADRAPSAPAAPPPLAPAAAPAPEPAAAAPKPIDTAPSPDLDPAPPIGDDVDWPPRRKGMPILLFVIVGLALLFVCGGVVSAGLVVALGFL